MSDTVLLAPLSAPKTVKRQFIIPVCFSLTDAAMFDVVGDDEASDDVAIGRREEKRKEKKRFHSELVSADENYPGAKERKKENKKYTLER